MRVFRTTIATILLAMLMLWPAAASASVPDASVGVRVAEADDGSYPISARGSLLQGKIPAEETVYVHKFFTDYFLEHFKKPVAEYFLVGNWDVSSVTLHLEYDVTPLEHTGMSDARVYLNGHEIYSLSLEKSGRGRQIVEIDLPVDKLNINNGNLLEIKEYLQWGGADNCFDDIGNGSRWLNFFKESYVKVDYSPLNTCDSIAEFFECITALESLDNGWSGIYLPKEPTAQELTVAVNIASGISEDAVKFYDSIMTGMGYDSIAESVKYAAYIGEYDSLEDKVKQSLSAQQKADAEKGALIALTKVGDRFVLVITGGDSEAFAKMPKAISNKEYVKTLGALQAKTSAQEDYLSEKYVIPQYIPLTENGEFVNGFFEQSVAFSIDYPANRRISQSSEIDIDFSYSEDLLFDRSLVTVFVNDQPVGSKKLSLENAQADNMVFSFPSDVNITGQFSVRITFELDVGDDWCYWDLADAPWAQVAPTSMLKIASVDIIDLNFENFPSPFIRDGSMNNAVIALPENPSQDDLQAMHGIALSLGRFAKDNNGLLSVVFQNETGDLSVSNVIAIGDMNSNIIADAQKDQLNFRFAGDNLMISDQNRGSESNYGIRCGVGQMIMSPYSDDVNALLVISGSSPQVTLDAARMMFKEDSLWKLGGDTYVADSKGEVRALKFDTDRSAYTMPAVKKDAASQASTQSLVIVAGMLALMLLAMFLILRKHRGGIQ